MKGEGRITFGGFLVAAGLDAHITLENGERWDFKGVMAQAILKSGELQVKGEFPGVAHMEGACTFSITGGALGSGNFEVKWGDTKGEIGTVKGTYKGVNVGAGAGTGDWSRGAAVGDRT